jgi:uncharacterized membrane protein
MGPDHAPGAGKHDRRTSDRAVHILFRIGILLKGIGGLLEFIGGAVLFFMTPVTINRLIAFLVSDQLADDPNDLIANYLVRLGHHFSVSGKTFASFYLVGHGLIKIFLVVSVLRNKGWAYPVAIAALLGFIGYQAFRLVHHFSAALLAFTLFDAIVVVLLWLEHRRRADNSQTADYSRITER